MGAILGTLAFILIVGWLIVKWDKQRSKDIAKRDLPTDDENSYS